MVVWFVCCFEFDVVVGERWVGFINLGVLCSCGCVVYFTTVFWLVVLIWVFFVVCVFNCLIILVSVVCLGLNLAVVCF